MLLVLKRHGVEFERFARSMVTSFQSAVKKITWSCEWERKMFSRWWLNEHNQTHATSLLSCFWKWKQMSLLDNLEYCCSIIWRTMRRMEELVDTRRFPITNYHKTAYGLCSLNGMIIFLKILSFVDFSWKSTIGFLRKLEFSMLHFWELKNVLISAPNSLVNFFWKNIDYFQGRTCVLSLCQKNDDFKSHCAMPSRKRQWRSFQKKNVFFGTPLTLSRTSPFNYKWM